MLALAIDSSQETCSIALGKDSQVLAEYHFYSKMSLLRRVVPNAELILKDAGLKVQDLDGVIISLGPGSFTGLRIGVTVAKSLAFVLSKPIIGIGTLDAIARTSAPVEADMICPMIFARANEVYWSLFDSSAQQKLAEYAVSTLDEVMESIETMGGRVFFCGSGAIRNADQIRERFGEDTFITKPWASYARGAALLELGMKRLADGEDDSALALTPMYIRKPTPVVRLETGEFERPTS